MPKLLGIDVGTSGCKALLIDERGRVLREASAEYEISVPRANWSEQNPEDWWAGVKACLAEIGEARPDAIGLTGQMHGAVFLDEALEVIRPAILWNDQRTTAECDLIEATIGRERLMALTCNPALTGFQLPKLLWLRRNEPECFARLRHLLLPKDYIRLKLSGEMWTEVSDASGTGCFSVPERRWSSEILEVLEVDPRILPDSVESFAIAGSTRAGQGAELEAGIPIVGGGGDQAAAAVGTGAVEPGAISVSLGTSGVVFTAIESPEYDPAGAAHTFCHANGRWHAMGVMLSCGGALRWYRDALAAGESYDCLASDASQAKPGCRGLTFLPYLTGERCPHNDPFASGAFAGLNLGHRRPEITRSVFEGATFGLLDSLDLLEGLGTSASELRVTGGGAKSAFWVQLLADASGISCVTLETDEGPAFGAAILAGVGIGVWPGVKEACREVVRAKQTISPSGANYEDAYRRYRHLYSSLKSWRKY